MTDFPLISIIIVTYKSRDEIGPCLESLPARLNDGVTEIIVVDNSPGDGAGELIRKRFPEVCYQPAEKNLGFGSANNLGFGRARGEFVLFLNPDTVCNAGALEHCIARLRADPRIGLISPQLVLPDGTMDLACRRSIPTLWDGFCRASGLAARWPKRKIFSGYNLTHLPADESYDVGAINGAFMLARRDVLLRVAEPVGSAGVFDESFFMYGDDLDLCIRVARAGWRIVYDGRVQIIHLKGVSVAKDFELMSTAIFDANREVWLKHFNPGGARWAQWKYRTAFGVWKMVAGWRAARREHRKVRPL